MFNSQNRVPSSISRRAEMVRAAEFAVRRESDPYLRRRMVEFLQAERSAASRVYRASAR